MFKILFFSFVISLNLVVCFGDCIEDTTELLLTFFIHRHGDRTPVEASIFFSTDATLVAELSAKYGHGQLTDVGVKHGYELGKFIRKRYTKLLSPSYNISEIYIRSTDSTRAKMTALAALAAVYPAERDNWSSEVNWTPVPYTTVPAKYDFNMASVNCPNLMSLYFKSFISNSSQMGGYIDVIKLWSEYIDYNITATPVISYVIHDVYTAQISLGVPLPEELQAIYPQITEAAGTALNVSFGSDKAVPYMAGPLLHEFFTVADQVVAGKDVQRVQWYSAHDVNVFSLMAAANITPRPVVPKYASMFALELRKTPDGEYIVVPVYLEDPSGDVESNTSYPSVSGCEGYCDLETFRTITAANVLDEDTWRTDCGFTSDLVIDESSIE